MTHQQETPDNHLDLLVCGDEWDYSVMDHSVFVEGKLI